MVIEGMPKEDTSCDNYFNQHCDVHAQLPLYKCWNGQSMTSFVQNQLEAKYSYE